MPGRVPRGGCRAPARGRCAPHLRLLLPPSPCSALKRHALRSGAHTRTHTHAHKARHGSSSSLMNTACADPHFVPACARHQRSTMVGGKGGASDLKKKPTSRSSRAGLQFPVGRIHRLLKVRGFGSSDVAGSPSYSHSILFMMAPRLACGCCCCCCAYLDVGQVVPTYCLSTAPSTASLT